VESSVRWKAIDQAVIVEILFVHKKWDFNAER
jgi:hypothetical protein